MNSGSYLDIAANNSSGPGSAGYDQLNVNGSITLGNSTLHLTGDASGYAGDQIILIHSTGQVNGTFTNYTGSATTFAIGSNTYQLSYNVAVPGGYGVVLTETDPTHTGPWLVNTTSENPSPSGNLPLRNAIALANLAGGAQTVGFYQSLWATNGPATVGFDGDCVLDGSLNIPEEITLQNSGSLKIANGSLNIDGNLTNTGTLSTSNCNLLVNGYLDLGGSSLTVESLDGDGGTITNNVTGTATLTLTADSIFNGSINDGNGQISLTTSATGNTVTIVDLLEHNSYSGVTTIDANSQLELWGEANGPNASIGGGNVVDNGELVFVDAAPLVFSNIISGTGEVLEDATSGDYTTTLTANNSYSGGTQIDRGTLLVDNSSGSGTGTGDVYVDDEFGGGSTLGGTGTISGTVTLSEPDFNSDQDPGSVLAPGNPGSYGVLTVGNLVMDQGSHLKIGINGQGAGIGYDQLVVTGDGSGAIQLSDADLNISYTSAIYVGNIVNVIENAGTDAISGNFDGVTEGAFVTLGVDQYKLSYEGGNSSNSVILSVAPYWTGATSGSGSANDPDYMFNNPDNWSNGIVDGTLDGVVLTGDTTLYLSGNQAALPNGLSLNYASYSTLTLESNSSSTCTLSVAGNFSSGYGKPGLNFPTVILGDPAAPLNLVLTNPTAYFSVDANCTVLIQNAVTATNLVLNGVGTLRAEDSGVLNASSLNLYSGALETTGTARFNATDINICGGLLKTAAADSFSTTSLSIDGGIFDLDGTEQAVTDINGAGGIILNSAYGTEATFSINTSDNNSSYSGTIADNTGQGGTLALALSLTGSIFTPSGNNTYSGGTTIENGTLELTSTTGNGAGVGPLIVDEDGELNLHSNALMTVANDISGSGFVDLDGQGTVICTGNNSFSGYLIIYGGELLVDGLFSNSVELTASNSSTLGGTGSINGSVTVNKGANLTPGDGGNSSGILSIANLDMKSGSVLNIAANGTTAGSGYSQLKITGTLDIESGSSLYIHGSLYEPQAVLTVIADGGVTVGSFALSTLELDGIWYAIDSTGGASGHDLTLTASPVVTFDEELIVNAIGGQDSVDVSQSGTNLSILFDGQTYNQPMPLAGLFIYTRGGTNSITIESGVSCRTTVETIAATGMDYITSGGSNVIVWDDSRDVCTYSAGTVVHTVASFIGGVNMGVGYVANSSLPDPDDIGTNIVHPLASLWGTGPIADDVNQGGDDDCVFMSTWAGFAQVDQSRLMKYAVDMGDGTSIVQFWYQGNPVYLRVNDDFDYGNAHPGANGTIWALVMEKAFAYFRTYDGTSSQNTYASIDFTSDGKEMFDDMNVTSDWLGPAASPSTPFPSETDFYNMTCYALESRDPIILTTSADSALVHNHAYTLISVEGNDPSGALYLVRNPWGTTGINNDGYFLLTFQDLQADFSGIVFGTD